MLIKGVKVVCHVGVVAVDFPELVSLVKEQNCRLVLQWFPIYRVYAN